MIDLITDHVISLLSVPGICAGGSAYPSGWSGYLLPDEGTATATAGRVNIFEHAYANAGDSQRPAIYLGMEKMEIQLHRGDPVAAGAGPDRVEFWWAQVPLVIACSSHVSMRDARKQRNQLLANVISILWSHISETEAWWNFSFADHLPIQLMASGSGGGAQAISEAIAIVPLTVSFSQAGNSPA
ncbi:MAG TPA: hypothetical protein VKT32_10640 [Chthonomonadaceae bacterium]|nr:hypothetical protein [Chthonomonadaceae bacterium]